MYWKLIFKYGLGIIGGLIIVWSLYTTVWKPHTKPPTTETQVAERIININYSFEPRQTFGCANYRVMKEKKNEVK